MDNPTPPSTQRLRSLAFALLAKREYSAQALKEKLLSYHATPQAVDALVQDLIANNYQSDERMAGMLVRANLRKGRGVARIQQDLKKHHIDATLAADELADIDWLQQAIELRVKKFGDALPTDAKKKARQLRFLQYRGFDFDICFKALQAQRQDD